MKYSRWETGNVSRWSNRTEDIAVDALGFILSRSRAARTALRNIIETAVQDIGELTGAKTQVTGDDGARPDLVVFGRGGKERVIVEAKFWAELTENQPGTYLARLPDDNADRWGGAWIGVNLELWAEVADTPVWLTFSDNDWNGDVISAHELRQILGEECWAGTPNSIPVYLPIGMERNAVLEAVVEQLSELAGLIGS